MSKNKTNQYRLKLPSRGGTKSYPRVKAIEIIASSTFPQNFSPKQFDNKKLSAEHRETLIKIANLWNRLTELENAVKERAKNPKTKSKP
jgi:hypothetical protein